MSKITKIGEKNKSNRCAVYLDDNFVCFLSEFTIFKYKLSDGRQIDLEELNKIQIESEQEAAFDLAIKYVTKYQKTEKELKSYLSSKGYLEQVCEEVLKKVKEYRYIDDNNYINSYIRNSKGHYGVNKIKQNLKQKGISEELLNQIEIEEDLGDLEEIAKKYLKNKEINVQNTQKCAKFLLSRGFEWSDIKQVLQKFKENDDESWQ